VELAIISGSGEEEGWGRDEAVLVLVLLRAARSSRRLLRWPRDDANPSMLVLRAENLAFSSAAVICLEIFSSIAMSRD
jgi:hypothetical protein